MIQKKTNTPAPLAKIIADAKQSTQISNLGDDVIAPFIRQEVKSSLLRMARVNVDREILMMAITDLVYDLKSEFHYLTLEEVAIALRQGTREADGVSFSSQLLYRWLKQYVHDIRPLAFKEIAPPVKQIPQSTFNPRDFIRTAYSRWEKNLTIYAPDRVCFHLEQLKEPIAAFSSKYIDRAIAEQWASLKVKDQFQISIPHKNIRKLDLIKAQSAPEEAAEWIIIAADRIRLTDYFQQIKEKNQEEGFLFDW